MDVTSSAKIKSCIFELYSPVPAECHFLNTRRSVSVVIDGKSKSFDTGGAPLEFEQVERYSARRIDQRFNANMLNDYLQHYGIQAFDENYYDTNSPAVLFEVSGAQLDQLPEYTLEQARIC
ncbi:MAG: hypothetical protein AB7Q00_00275 [Phycisphaerales bacterium]